MEYLSIALVLIFVMWLIDKHNVWRQTGKLALIVIAVTLIAGASFYGWTKYRDWKAEKVALIAEEKHKAAVKECLSRLSRAGSSQPRQDAIKNPLVDDPDVQGKTDVFDEAACEADPNVNTADVQHKAAVKKCLSRVQGKPDVFDQLACEDNPHTSTP
jgi:hypothetical protein